MLRVLIVEDSADDAELLLRELRQGGYEPTHARVETAETLSAELAARAWDIVISDFAMPQFDAFDALALLRSTGLELPFIIVSGTIGEDRAVAAMQAGAHDYIMKGNLKRLVPAVERELEQAGQRQARRQTEEALRHARVDITERKAVEAAITAAHAEAERANLAKSEFLSRMSHELRTPLNAVLGFAQLLELDELSSDQRESVTHIGRAGRHLLELINEVLDISRIETGQVTISLEPMAVAATLEELVALIGPLADGRSITIDATRTGCDVHVLADRQRLRQVLLNLLANAVKYNREGGSVTVACAVVAGDRLRMSVTDTGYGIPPDQLERLFRPFERLGAEQSGVEGTGLGLAVSRGLVEAMGGRIGVESELDRGTTFWVEFGLVESPLLLESPLETYDNGRPDEEPTVAASAGRTHKVLHIEDHLSNLTLVERILARRPDIELLSAMQGRLGIDLARQHRPDVVLLDLHMPDMSGREVLQLLRSYPETRDTPVVIISADATKTQIARLTADGATGYLTKPLDIKAFMELIDSVLGDSPPDGSVSTPLVRRLSARAD